MLPFSNSSESDPLEAFDGIFQNVANIIGGNRGALGRAESAPTLSTIALKTVSSARSKRDVIETQVAVG